MRVFFRHNLFVMLARLSVGLALLLCAAIAQLHLYAQDTSCSIIWYPAIQLGDSSDGGYSPRIALSGEDTVHVTWWQDVPPGRTRLPYARSVVKNVFEPVRDLITDTITFRYKAYTPFILADYNIVRIVFAYTGTSWPRDTPLRMISSSDFGETWSDVQNISPQRAGRLLYATMRRDTIAIIYPPDTTDRLLRSSTGGQTWSQTDENLFPTPRIALTSQALHLVKNTAYGGHAEVLYKRSSNLGDSWNLEEIISVADEYWSDIPRIAGYTSECGTELLTAWRDDKYGCEGGMGGCSIISRASINNGQSWLAENLMTTEPEGTEPEVGLSKNIRAVGWAHEKYFMEFDGHIRVTNNSLLNYCPIYNLALPYTEGGVPEAIAVSSHAVHIVYTQFIGNVWRVFYRRGEFVQKDVDLSLSIGSLEMDTTEIGRTTTDTVSVINTGSDTMTVGTAISDNENFSVTPDDTTVAPYGEAVFTVNFTPKSFGTHTGKIIFYHNGQSATGGSPDCFDVKGTSIWRKETISYQEGEWNMVSIPMKPGPVQSLPSMFSYEGSYVPRDTIEFGKGYWSKPYASEITYQGSDVWSDTFAVRAGWNMIGSLTGEVLKSDITTIPESIITSLFYMFDGEKYVSADTIKPGRSYWIKVKVDGKLILKSE